MHNERADDYNFDSFERKQVREALQFQGGPRPGAPALDFRLKTVSGAWFHLAEHTGTRPVLVEFVSLTCPMTAASRGAMRRLYRQFGGEIEFVSVYVREAHPGETYPHHETHAQKTEHARDWAEREHISWTVCVDELVGTVHGAYGEAYNAAYLIDRSGHVALRSVWAGEEERLEAAVTELLERDRAGEHQVDLGEIRRRAAPFLHGFVETSRVLGRAGERARDDARRVFGRVLYGVSRLAGLARPVVHRS